MIDAMVQRIGDDRVPLVEQRLEHAAVRVETRGIENRVFRAEIVGDRALQLLMDILRAADETHRRHAVASAVHGPLGRLDQTGMVRKPQIVVGAEIDHLFSSGHPDRRALGRDDHPLALVQPGLAERVELGAQMLFHFPVHASKKLNYKQSYIFPAKSYSGMRKI